MKCPYCMSSIDSQAQVCKHCNRDISLVKQLMYRISHLEQTLQSEQSKQKIDSESEALVTEDATPQVALTVAEKLRKLLFDFMKFFIVPLLLLLLAHVCITIVYDTKILYLRIVTLILPLCFGYLLCRNQSRNIFTWTIGVLVLGWVAVAGMSAATSVVDDSPIWPQSIYVWRDLIEFAASISFSYVTGMFLGHLAFLKTKNTLSRTTRSHKTDRWITDADDDRAQSASLQFIAKKISEFTTTLGAIVTTIIAIYTGLKGLF